MKILSYVCGAIFWVIMLTIAAMTIYSMFAS